MRWRYVAYVGKVGPDRETTLARTQGEALRFVRKARHVGKPWALFLLLGDGNERHIASGTIRRDEHSGQVVRGCL